MLSSIKTSSKVLSAGRRCFSLFSGADQVVYLAGKAVREVGGKKVDVPVTRELIASPSINTVTIEGFTGASDAVAAEHSITSFLLAKDGAAKVRAISVEEPYTASSAKFAGAPFQWTGLTVSETFTTGSKAETQYTFGDKDVPYVSTVTGKDGKVVYKESGSLKAVSFPDFNTAKKVVTAEIAAAETARVNEVLAQAAKNKPAEF